MRAAWRDDHTARLHLVVAGVVALVAAAHVPPPRADPGSGSRRAVGLSAIVNSVGGKGEHGWASYGYCQDITTLAPSSAYSLAIARPSSRPRKAVVEVLRV